jgi:hypothetical protein
MINLQETLMKKIFIKHALSLVWLVLLSGFFSACEDDSESDKNVQLLSFGPSGVHHGDQIVFIGKNLDKVNSIVLQPNVEVTSFVEKTSSQIKLIVPAEAEAGKVVLKFNGGEIESKTILNFKVPVTITSITEEAKPGTNITISGDKVNWIEKITFEKDIVVTKENFVSTSLTELVVTVPMEAQTGFLIFSTAGTEKLTFGSETPLTVTLPTVSSVSPSAVRHTEEITISGTDLDLVNSVVFSGGTEVSEFTSHTATEIKLLVPATAVKGKLTLKQASPVDIVTEDELTIILPVGTSVTPTPTKPGVDEITIVGTDLDLVAKIKLPGAGEIPASSFTSQTATEIKLAVPASATQGAIEYETIHGFAGALGVVLKLPPTGSFPTLDYYIYKDGLKTGWSAWGGWGHVSQDYANTENPADGTSAIKVVFNDQYGAIQIHNDGASNIFSSYNYLVFYVYVQGEDSDIIVQIDNNGDYYPAHFTKNKYHQIVVPLASLQGSGSVGELRFKNNNPVSDQNTVVFIDEIGLTVDTPPALLPELVTVIYDESVSSAFGTGGGWGGATMNASSAEQQRAGDVSIKATFAGGYSGTAQFGTWGQSPVTTSGMQYLAFSIYGGTGSGGNKVIVNIRPTVDAADVQVQVTVQAGKWTDVQIPLSDFGSPAGIGAIAFQDAGWAGTVYIDHLGLQ